MRNEVKIKSKKVIKISRIFIHIKNAFSFLGTMTVNDGVPVTGTSDGKFQGLDLINPLYIGGVPDISQINEQAGFVSGFEGCISRLVIGTVISELMRDARSQVLSRQ